MLMITDTKKCVQILKKRLQSPMTPPNHRKEIISILTKAVMLDKRNVDVIQLLKDIRSLANERY